jgi:hypothetical protein
VATGQLREETSITEGGFPRARLGATDLWATFVAEYPAGLEG